MNIPEGAIEAASAAIQVRMGQDVALGDLARAAVEAAAPLIVAHARAEEARRAGDYLQKMSTLYDGPLADNLARSDRAHAIALYGRADALVTLKGQLEDHK